MSGSYGSKVDSQPRLRGDANFDTTDREMRGRGGGSALLLSGCWESEEEKKAQAPQAASENLWNIIPPDESQDEGFTP